MYRGVEYTKGQIAAGVCSLVALTIAAYGYTNERNTAARDLAIGQARIQSAQQAIGQLAAKGDPAQLEAARARVGTFQARLVKPEVMASLYDGLGADWLVTLDGRKAFDGYASQSATLVFTSSAVGDWPKIVATVEKIEALSGASVTSLEINAEGDADHRTFRSVRLEITYLTPLDKK